MRVLVTGGAGFIGSTLCRSLAARPGVSVRVLDDLSTGDVDNLVGTTADLVRGSILDEQLLAAVTRDVDAVVHLAALPSVPRSVSDPVGSFTANADGTLKVLEAARSAGAQVVVASSSSVYGANRELPKREDMVPRPLSPYAASKLAAESLALAYQHSYGLPVVAFRFFNVYGPRQRPGSAYAAVIPSFVSAILAGDPVTIFGDGHQTRDFTYVETVTDVVARVVTQRLSSPTPVNLAFSTRTSLLELVAELEGVLGPVAVEHRAEREGDVRDSQADTSVLSRLVPDVMPLPLSEGLRRTVVWLREHRERLASGQ